MSKNMLANGRNRTSRFARLEHRILNSNAYRALSPNARSLLIELISLYNGKNNGSLFLSVRDAAHRMGLADTTAASGAFDELMELGFIVMTVDAEFRSGSSDQSRARCWRLTFEHGPGRKGPTMDFMEREPQPKTRAYKRMERGLRVLKTYRKAQAQNRLPVLDSDTLAAFQPALPPVPVLDSNTPNAENDSFPPKCIVRDSATHTATTRGREAGNCLLGWWEPDWGYSIKAWSIAAMIGAAKVNEKEI